MKNTFLAVLVVAATVAPSNAWAAPVSPTIYTIIRTSLQREVCAAVRMPVTNPSVIGTGLRDLISAAMGCPLV